MSNQIQTALNGPLHAQKKDTAKEDIYLLYLIYILSAWWLFLNM